MRSAMLQACSESETCPVISAVEGLVCEIEEQISDISVNYGTGGLAKCIGSTREIFIARN